MKNKTILPICIFVLMFLLYTGCKNDTATLEDKEILNNSFNQGITTSTYHLNKTLIDGNNCFEVAELSLPQNINNMKIAPLKIIKESNLLVLLYIEDTLPELKEIGVYDWKSEQYSSYFTII